MNNHYKSDKEIGEIIEKELIEYEICDNPDHNFIDSFGNVGNGDIGRIGCLMCGHDEEHRIKSTRTVKNNPEKLKSFIFALRHSDREALIEKVKKMDKPNVSFSAMQEAWVVGYKMAVKDILSLLNEEVTK